MQDGILAITSKYNAGASLNYRNKNINIFSTYSYNYTPNEQHFNYQKNVYWIVFLISREPSSTFVEAHNFKVGADYFVNKKNTIGVMVNGIFADPASTSNSKTYISNTTTNTVDRILVADNNNGMKRHNANINLNYNYTDPKGTKS